MPVKMPLAPPTRTIDSIGQVKVDRVRVPNFTEYVPAAEWNNAMDELIACCQLTLNLAAAGTTGTLQQIYNNGLGPLSAIILDVVRGGVIIRDANPAIGLPLLQVTNNAGGVNYLNITASDWAIFSTNGGMRTDPGLPGTIRLDRTGGCNLYPSENGKGTLGASTDYFDSCYALAHATKSVTVTPAAAPVFDASKGSIQQVTLTADMTGFTFTNLRPGQIITCIFTQDGAGGHYFSGTVAGGVTLADSAARFTLPPEPGASVAITFRKDTLTALILEIGRTYSITPPAQRVQRTTLNATPIVLHVRRDAGVQIFDGTLGGPVGVNILNALALAGDRFTFIFDESNGVITSAMNILTLSAGGAPAPCSVVTPGATAIFNQAKALRGKVDIVFDGANWIYAFGGAVTYL